MSAHPPVLHQWLHALARDELALATAKLDDDAHAARVQCKRLRALLRLLKPQLGARYAKANALLRDAAQALAGRRRETALRELCEALHKIAPEQDWMDIAARLPEAKAEHYDAAAARARLEAAARLLDTELPPLTPEQLAQRLHANYRRCRRDLRRIEVNGDSTPLHEWRKQVKYHGYQCHMLAPLWPALHKRRRRLTRLWDALGMHQDLADLRAELTRRRSLCAGGFAVAQRREWIDAHQQRLAAEALRRGRRLFDRKPRAWWAREIAAAQ